MKRIQTSTAVPNLIAVGKAGFTDGDASVGLLATDLEARFFNQVQEAIVRTQEAAGLPPSDDYDQFTNAIIVLIEDRFGDLSAVPTGTVLDYAGTSVPPGFLQCPTAVTNIPRATYAALFAVVGTTWGAGDGSTTFGMPYFPADQAGVQANGNVGTNTVGEVIQHAHTTGDSTVQNNVALNSGGPGMRNAGTALSGSTGGTANLAAGMRVMKIVKY